MSKFTHHIFVCINERAEGHPRGCCKEKGGIAVRDKLKKELTRAGLHGLVRANKAGCLDQCEQGVTMVVYPEQVWYGGVTVDDVEEIVQSHLVGGNYVTRLMLDSQPHLDGATTGPPVAPKPLGKADVAPE